MVLLATRTAVLYLVVILCMRVMGKRQVGELQPSELVVTILISELASIPMQDLSRPVTNGIISILVLVLLELLLSFITLKSDFFRRIFEGKSAIIIKNGVIDQKMMKKLRVSIDDLLEGIRQAGSFSVNEVYIAIMETNGKISVMPKSCFLPVNKKDLKINARDKGFPTVIISDGKLKEDVFLQFTNITKEDALAQLKHKNLCVEDVFLMTVNEAGEFLIIKKEG